LNIPFLIRNITEDYAIEKREWSEVYEDLLGTKEAELFFYFSSGAFFCSYRLAIILSFSLS